MFARLNFAFQQTRDALAATGGNAAAAADGVKLIKKMIILTFARATLKYAHNRNPPLLTLLKAGVDKGS